MIYTITRRGTTKMNLKNLPILPILPDAWLGIVGGGQLGRMFCFAAQKMGYRVTVLDPNKSSPAGAVADRHLLAPYDDEIALTELAQLCAAVSIEFENVPAASINFLARTTFVSPAGHCVAIAQNRLIEKRFMAETNIPIAPYLAIKSSEALAAINDDILKNMLPGILKTAQFGYDGKGQICVTSIHDVHEAHVKFDSVPCVLEKRLSLKFEVSALIVRGLNGTIAVYPLAQNMHHHNVLTQTIAPAPDVNTLLIKQAQQAAVNIATKLNYVGVLCVEFFVLKNGVLIANEMATRPHNSGHYTIDACATSQFEQQVRAMTGMPLGNTRQHSSAVMLNIFGDTWFPDVENSENGPKKLVIPPWHQVAAIPDAHLHLYGKVEPWYGRKMGHINFTPETLDEARMAAYNCAHLLHIAQ